MKFFGTTTPPFRWWRKVISRGVCRSGGHQPAHEMEPAVTAAIKKAGLWGKIVGKVSDGGANLLKLWRALKTQGRCEAIGLKESYDGTCYTHGLNGMTRDATNSQCRGLNPDEDASKKTKPK